MSQNTFSQIFWTFEPLIKHFFKNNIKQYNLQTSSVGDKEHSNFVWFMAFSLQTCVGNVRRFAHVCWMITNNLTASVLSDICLYDLAYVCSFVISYRMYFKCSCTLTIEANVLLLEHTYKPIEKHRTPYQDKCLILTALILFFLFNCLALTNTVLINVAVLKTT